MGANYHTYDGRGLAKELARGQRVLACAREAHLWRRPRVRKVAREGLASGEFRFGVTWGKRGSKCRGANPKGKEALLKSTDTCTQVFVSLFFFCVGCRSMYDATACTCVYYYHCCERAVSVAAPVLNIVRVAADTFRLGTLAIVAKSLPTFVAYILVQWVENKFPSPRTVRIRSEGSPATKKVPGLL